MKKIILILIFALIFTSGCVEEKKIIVENTLDSNTANAAITANTTLEITPDYNIISDFNLDDKSTIEKSIMMDIVIDYDTLSDLDLKNNNLTIYLNQVEDENLANEELVKFLYSYKSDFNSLTIIYLSKEDYINFSTTYDLNSELLKNIYDINSFNSVFKIVPKENYLYDDILELEDYFNDQNIGLVEIYPDNEKLYIDLDYNYLGNENLLFYMVDEIKEFTVDYNELTVAFVVRNSADWDYDSEDKNNAPREEYSISISDLNKYYNADVNKDVLLETFEIYNNFDTNPLYEASE